MIERQFGELLRTLRKEGSLTQSELAHKAGLDRTYISLLERGIRQPSLIALFKLSSALEVELSEIIRKLEIVLDENSK